MIIGIVGFAGSGKGTASDILVKNFGFTKLAFADSVKDATAAIFGWSRAMLEGDTEASREFRERRDDWWSERFGYNVTPRYMLQLMGTEACRDNIHQDIWISSLERKLEMYENVVVSDVRFQNEIKFIQSKGGFIVRVIRNNDPEWYDTAYQANNHTDPIIREDHIGQMNFVHKVHASEWSWIGPHYNYVLDNNGSIDMLDAQVKHMLRVFTGPKNPASLAA